MNMELQLLSEKIARLAELTQSLRKENTEYRLAVAALTDENTALSQRMDEAAVRLKALLEKFPAMAEATMDTDEEPVT